MGILQQHVPNMTSGIKTGNSGWWKTCTLIFPVEVIPTNADGYGATVTMRWAGLYNQQDPSRNHLITIQNHSEP